MRKSNSKSILTKNHWASWFSRRWLKILKCSVSLAWLGKCSKRLHHWHVWFFKKNLSDVIFYQLSKFHCLIAFTSWDIGQYVYCNCFVSQVMTSSILKLTLSFWTIRFSIWPKSQDKHLNILRMKRAFKVK